MKKEIAERLKERGPLRIWGFLTMLLKMIIIPLIKFDHNRENKKKSHGTTDYRLTL